MRSLFNKYGVVQTCIVNTDKRHAFIKMVTRHDAIAARDGMESYKSGDMQLRVSITIPVFFLFWFSFSNFLFRPDGVLVSVRATVATTRPASVSSRSNDSPRRIANGCLRQNTVALEEEASRVAWSSKSQILKSVPVSRPKVS